MNQVVMVIGIISVLAVVQAANLRLRSPSRFKSELDNVPQNTSDRIAGGEQATRGQFPYQAALIIDGVFFCGGSLISVDTILTAANCVDGYSTWQVHLGAQTLSNLNEAGRVIIVTTDSLIHGNYVPPNIENDVALLFLGQQLTTNEFIDIIRLPAISNSDLFEGATARASGWGLSSDELNFIDMRVITNEECQAEYPTLFDSHICTAGDNGLGICKGDFGGPLVLVMRAMASTPSSESHPLHLPVVVGLDAHLDSPGFLISSIGSLPIPMRKSDPKRNGYKFSSNV